MKKILSTILAGALLLSMGTTALAVEEPIAAPQPTPTPTPTEPTITTVTTPGETEIKDFTQQTDIPVTLQYSEDPTPPADVYSVDIAWGAMEFTYTAPVKTWKPDKLEYETTKEVWEVEEGANVIEITNRSNKPVTACFDIKDVISGFNAELTDVGIGAGYATLNTKTDEIENKTNKFFDLETKASNLVVPCMKGKVALNMSGSTNIDLTTANTICKISITLEKSNVIS